jgi:hypothetical protein
MAVLGFCRQWEVELIPRLIIPFPEVMMTVSVDSLAFHLWNFAVAITPPTGNAQRDSQHRSDAMLYLRLKFLRSISTTFCAFGFDGYIRRRLAEVQACDSDPHSLGAARWAVYAKARAQIEPHRYKFSSAKKYMVDLFPYNLTRYVTMGEELFNEPGAQQKAGAYAAEEFLDAYNAGMRSRGATAVETARAFADAALPARHHDSFHAAVLRFTSSGSS